MFSFLLRCRCLCYCECTSPRPLAGFIIVIVIAIVIICIAPYRGHVVYVRFTVAVFPASASTVYLCCTHLHLLPACVLPVDGKSKSKSAVRRL
jgi:hypothetical protein